MMIRVANTLIVAVGVVLELGLLGMLVRFRLYRRLALFAILLSFYGLRALVLILAARSMVHSSYVQLVSLLTIPDALLQVGVAIFLSLRVWCMNYLGRNRARELKLLFLVLAGLMVAGTLTIVVVRRAPLHAPVSLDRVVLFPSFLFITYYLLSWPASRFSFEGTLLRGFAWLGFVEVLAQLGKSMAASYRSPALFLFFAYLDSGVWLLVLSYWIWKLRSQVNDEQRSDGVPCIPK